MIDFVKKYISSNKITMNNLKSVLIIGEINNCEDVDEVIVTSLYDFKKKFGSDNNVYNALKTMFYLTQFPVYVITLPKKHTKEETESQLLEVYNNIYNDEKYDIILMPDITIDQNFKLVKEIAIKKSNTYKLVLIGTSKFDDINGPELFNTVQAYTQDIIDSNINSFSNVFVIADNVYDDINVCAFIAQNLVLMNIEENILKKKLDITGLSYRIATNDTNFAFFKGSIKYPITIYNFVSLASKKSKIRNAYNYIIVSRLIKDINTNLRQYVGHAGFFGDEDATTINIKSSLIDILSYYESKNMIVDYSFETLKQFENGAITFLITLNLTLSYAIEEVTVQVNLAY